MIVTFHWINGICLGFDFVKFDDGNVLAVDLLILRIMFDFPSD